jgi:dolichol-phosphate mannosyltransferase
MNERLRALLGRFIKFGIVGGSGVVVNLGIYVALTRGLGWESNLGAMYLAYAFSVEVSIITNFLFNDIWTFADRRESVRWRIRFLRFHVVSLVGMAVNWGVFAFLNALIAAGQLRLLGEISMLGWQGNLDDVVAACLGIIAAMLWNFFANLLWTWKTK